MEAATGGSMDNSRPRNIGIASGKVRLRWAATGSLACGYRADNAFREQERTTAFSRPPLNKFASA
jgi:hypothetical protein